MYNTYLIDVYIDSIGKHMHEKRFQVTQTANCVSVREYLYLLLKLPIFTQFNSILISKQIYIFIYMQIREFYIIYIVSVAQTKAYYK